MNRFWGLRCNQACGAPPRIFSHLCSRCSNKPLTAKPQMALALQKLSPCSQPAPALSGKTPGPLSARPTRVLRKWVFPRSWDLESNHARRLCQQNAHQSRHTSQCWTQLCAESSVSPAPTTGRTKLEPGYPQGRQNGTSLFKPAMPFLYHSFPFILANQQLLQFQRHKLKALTMGITAGRV